MIQRIQTIYLLFATVLISLMHFFPIVKILTVSNAIVVFRSHGFFAESMAEGLLPSVPFFILISVVMLLYVAAIFLFRNRNLQARICRLNILLLIGSLGLMTYYILQMYKKMAGVEYSFQIAVLFPLISIVLTWLAIRGIVKDEALVRSVDKIR
ncbi:MAG: DUF4293 domain-containing protein [Bacteroidales bacterium]|nr:DUF4293 domain-containing protein [Bacteroidales bacterium]